MEMANNNKYTELKSTEEVNFKMRRSFSWDRAFFTSDGFLAAEELSSMIEGGGDDVKHELQKIEEPESLEAKLFQDMEASAKKSTGISTVTNSSRDSQAKKVTGTDGPPKDATIKTPPARSSLLSCGGGSGSSLGKNIKTLARRGMNSKTSKRNSDSPSKTPPGITTKNKEASVNAGISRTSPASPVSPASSGSSSTFAVNQRPKRSGSVPPRRSSVNNEIPSAVDARRDDDWKSSKPAVSLMPKTQSSITLKIKPSPAFSHPSSPSGLSNSSSSLTTQRSYESSSSPTCAVDQRPKSRGIKGSTVQQTSKQTSKNRPTRQTIDPNGKQPAATFKPGRTNGSKTVAAANAGVTPNSMKTTTRKKQLRGTENILIISPEILDLKGKINALKMEISMQKKERCNKMAGAEGNSKTPFAIEECSQ